MHRLFPLLLVFAGLQLAGEEDAPELPPAVRRVLQEHAEALEEARNAYLEAVAEANEAAVAALQDEQRRITKRGDLETALAVKEKIGEIRAMVARDMLGRPIDSTDNASPARLVVRGVPTRKLAEGATSQSNRSYTWIDVPQELIGKTYTLNAGGQSTEVDVEVLKPGVVYVALCASAADRQRLVASGFEKTDLTMRYTDANRTRMFIYRAVVNRDFRLPAAKFWTGYVLIY